MVGFETETMKAATPVNDLPTHFVVSFLSLIHKYFIISIMPRESARSLELLIITTYILAYTLYLNLIT